ncbi:MAG: tRNA glutamyl-Q(34) synthetase GluQRS [Deltaproteobacteria bacterium]
MSARNARGRFAPSPTGELHLGSLRTALLAWLQIRALGGSFSLRVEDLDLERSRPAQAERQLDSLKTLGFDWDEKPVFQSARSSLYEEAIRSLTAKGLVYPCYCSRAEIARSTSAPHGPADDGPRYSGRCRLLGRVTTRERGAAGRAAALRFRAREGQVRFEDGILGAVAQDVQATVGDFVIRRADGVFAYQLAVVVDDIAMQMTHVLRGADLVSSTPRQLLLYEALGQSPPRFFHAPLIRGPDHEKLSKRHGPVGIETLLSMGVPPAFVISELARLCGLPARRLPQELVEGFDLARLPRGEVSWSPEELLQRASASSSAK